MRMASAESSWDLKTTFGFSFSSMEAIFSPKHFVYRLMCVVEGACGHGSSMFLLWQTWQKDSAFQKIRPLLCRLESRSSMIASTAFFIFVGTTWLLLGSTIFQSLPVHVFLQPHGPKHSNGWATGPQARPFRCWCLIMEHPEVASKNLATLDWLRVIDCKPCDPARNLLKRAKRIHAPLN